MDFNEELVISGIRDVLSRPEMNTPDSLLVLNLGVHFIKTINFSSYQRLLDGVIRMLKETERTSSGETVPKYQTKFIWKTFTALHKEHVKTRQSANYRFFTYPVNT